MVIAIDVHGDDLALFGAFLCLRHKPLVLITHASVPESEIADAMEALGCQWRIDPFAAALDLKAELVIAPAWEKHGLFEHNFVAEAVTHPNTIRYTTYAGHPRQKSRGREVEFKPEWLFAKHRALAAFESQAATPSWMHFVEDLREYVV